MASKCWTRSSCLFEKMKISDCHQWMNKIAEENWLHINLATPSTGVELFAAMVSVPPPPTKTAPGAARPLAYVSGEGKACHCALYLVNLKRRFKKDVARLVILQISS